jgi:multiple sugar transport system substrate-binding protein
MDHKRLLVAPGAVALALAMAACQSGGTAEQSAQSDGPTTITMWGRSDDAAFLPDLVDAFNAAQDETAIDLSLVPAEQVAQKFSAAAAGGTSPDIVALDLATVPQYAGSGWLADLTDKEESLDYKDQLSPAHLDLATLDGALYALPFSGDVSVLYFNKDLYKKAGLDPEKAPTTWDEIVSDAEDISALGGGASGYYYSLGCAGCMAFGMLPYAFAEGGDIFDDDGEPLVEGNEALADSLQLFQDLWAHGSVDESSVSDSGANQFEPFFSGRAGMFVNGSYPYGTLRDEHPDVNFGIAAVPSKDGSETGAYVGGDSIAITSTSQNPDAAWKALSWFTSDGQKELAKAGVLPTRIDIAEDEFASQDPRLEPMVEGLKVGKTPKSAKVAALLFDNNGPWNALVNTAVVDGDIPGAQTSAQQAMEELLGE